MKWSWNSFLEWLASFIYKFFGRPMVVNRPQPSELSKAYFITPEEAKKRDKFLADAKRPDWNEDDCLSAKMFVTDLITARTLTEIDELPQHYFCLLNDDTLLNAFNSTTRLLKKLDNEKVRRGV